jgi:hypothetical protein
MWEHWPFWIVLPPPFGNKKRDDGCTPEQTGTLRKKQGSSWRKTTAGKAEPREDKIEHSPQKKKRLKEGAM